MLSLCSAIAICENSEVLTARHTSSLCFCIAVAASYFRLAWSSTEHRGTCMLVWLFGCKPWADLYQLKQLLNLLLVALQGAETLVAWVIFTTWCFCMQSNTEFHPTCLYWCSGSDQECELLPIVCIFRAAQQQQANYESTGTTPNSNWDLGASFNIYVCERSANICVAYIFCQDL